LTTIAVHDLDEKLNMEAWSATFETDRLLEDEAREMLESALVANCLAQKEFLELRS
jgi:hypothetical protein